MTIRGLVLLAVAAVLLGASAAAWSGRWRTWPYRIAWRNSPITILPALGIALIAGALYEAKVISTRSPVAVIAFLILLAGAILSFWQPRWWGPGWYRRRPNPSPPDLSDPLTAAMFAYGVRSGLGEHASSATAHRHFETSQRLASWKAKWLAGSPNAKRETRDEQREGHLELYADGLAFSASDLEDRLRQKAVVVTIDREQINGARVVPAGAGPDGHKLQASGPRSAFPRLVVDTTEGPYLFEVNFAKQKARRISETAAG